MSVVDYTRGHAMDYRKMTEEQAATLNQSIQGHLSEAFEGMGQLEDWCFYKGYGRARELRVLRLMLEKIAKLLGGY